jgi:hypothetical protein
MTGKRFVGRSSNIRLRNCALAAAWRDAGDRICRSVFYRTAVNLGFLDVVKGDGGLG